MSDPLTFLRPTSSLSVRPTSRTSQRPVSRLSQFSVTRQTRVHPWLKTLIKQVAGLDEECNPDEFQEAWATATKHTDRLLHSTYVDSFRVDPQISGHITKAQINVQNVLADRLRVTYSILQQCMKSLSQRSSLDGGINSTNVPAVVQFLLHLSSPPDASTLAYAEYICHRSESEGPQLGLTWAEILNEEPFTGQHWQGAYGLPRGSVVETWDSCAESSEADLSSRESDEYEFATPPASVRGGNDENDHQPTLDNHKHPPPSNQSLSNRIAFEKLSNLQYWYGVEPSYPTKSNFDFNRPWTLGPTADSLSEQSRAVERTIIYIKEINVIREVLFLLQGLPSIMFNYDNDTIAVDNNRRIRHLTQSAQTSILNVFASLATKMRPLRLLAADLKSEDSRTFEAFATGVARQLQRLDAWCSNLETQINAVLSPRNDLDIGAISLLQLQFLVEERAAYIFDDLLNVIRMWESQPATTRLSGHLINTIWQCLKDRQTLQDEVTVKALWEVLITTIEPLWLNLGRWLKNGIPIDLGLEEGESKLTPTWNVDEFFVRINPLIDAAAPDFWEAKYTLQRNPAHAETAESPIPLFLADLADDILAAGKSVGFLRAMGLSDLLKVDWVGDWTTFEIATRGLPTQEINLHLGERMSNVLMAPCRLAQNTLSQVLIDESQLWKHLQNMEAICLMTRGDLMSQFNEQLFSKMDSLRYIWHDYHFMNAAFRKVVKLDHSINPSLVTFNYKTVRERRVDRTVAAIEGLIVEYAVPFPLVYLFGPESSPSYSQMFCFLLQIERSKFILDQISLNKVNAQFSKQRPFLITFYIIKWRLTWFIGTLLSFIKMHVIDVAVQDFHKSLLSASSLDEMIKFHHLHLERILHRSFLRENTSALHQAILSILNLSLRLNDCLMSHKVNDRDFTRSSNLFKSSLSKRSNFRRSRKKADVIGFVEDVPQSSDEDDSEDEINIEITESFQDGGSTLEQLNHINKELESLTGFVLRGVQILASSVTDASDTFGVLAFLLEGEI